MARFQVFRGGFEERQWPLPWNESIIFVVRRAGYVPFARWQRKQALEKMAALSLLPPEAVDEIFGVRDDDGEEQAGRRVTDILKKHKVPFPDAIRMTAEMGDSEVPGDKAALLVAEVKGERLDLDRENDSEVVAEFLDAYPMVTKRLLRVATELEQEFAAYLRGAEGNSDASSEPSTDGGSGPQPIADLPTSEPPSDATPTA